MAASPEALWGYSISYLTQDYTFQPDVEVTFGPEFNASPLPQRLSDEGEALWAAKVASKPTLFNGLKDIGRVPPGRGRRDRGVCTWMWVVHRLLYGLTDYQSYVTTNAAGADRIAALTSAAAAAGCDRYAYLSNPIGIDVVCRTADGMIVLLRRSSAVLEATHAWATVGGHPEPYSMFKAALGSLPHSPAEAQVSPYQVFEAHHRWVAEEKARRPSRSREEDVTLLGELVVREIFDAALREVEEELGLAKDLLVKPKQGKRPALLLGAFQPGWVEGKVDVVFLIETSLTFTQVASVYDKGIHQDAFEHDALDGLTEVQTRTWLAQADEAAAAAVAERERAPPRKISPYTRAALDIYMRVMEKKQAS